MMLDPLPKHWAASCYWESYPWKNELDLQSKRVEEHYLEVLNEDFEGDWSPQHMLERALVLSAFAMRRMFEKRLVTDKLRQEKREFTALPVTESFRTPFHGSTGGQVFKNYDFQRPTRVKMHLSDLANEIIHSSQLLVLLVPRNHDQDY